MKFIANQAEGHRGFSAATACLLRVKIEAYLLGQDG